MHYTQIALDYLISASVQKIEKILDS